MLESIKLSRSFLGTLILIPILWLALGYAYINKRTNDLKEQKYTEVSKIMHDELQTLISEKMETILIIAMVASNNPHVKNVLLKKNGELKLDTFSQELRNNTSLKNIWFQVVSNDGTSLYRSWTKKNGDNLKNVRVDVSQMIKNPKITSSISIGKFDLAFKSMVPIFNNEQFLGFVEVIAKFNSVAIKMEQKNYDTVILVDKKYKKQLTRPFTKTFVEDYYVANLNAKHNLLSYIKDTKVSHFINLQQHMISSETSTLISVYHLKDIYDNDMSYIVLFHNLENIGIENITQRKERLVIILLLIFFFIIALYYYGYIKKYRHFIQNINARLGEEVLNKTKELEHIANHDDLTGLPNRLLFLDRLEQSIKHAKRQKASVTILFLDLDRFKEVNDTYGHRVGDLLLKEVGTRLSKSVREEDTISRLGGDEFTVILEDLDESSSIHIAKKILIRMREKILIENTEVHTTFSIGISRYPEDGTSSDLLLRNADTAMYKAKEMGKNQYQFYNEEMTRVAMKKSKTEADLRLALQNNEFIPYYQAKVDALNNTVIGMEALIRWEHPDLGLVMPGSFIPVAEETMLILPIDKWMMKETVAQLTKWRKEGIHTGQLSLNLSMKQLEDKNCISHLKELTKDLDNNIKHLELEITESQIMKNPEHSIQILTQIRELGITISVDDFGTGYSSLSYLKRLPIDKLKIDRSFIVDLPHDENDIAIVRAIIALAKSLNLSLIAEGVETKEQLDFLVKEGCPNIQGYYYSKPIPADEYRDFLKQYQ